MLDPLKWLLSFFSSKHKREKPETGLDALIESTKGLTMKERIKAIIIQDEEILNLKCRDLNFENLEELELASKVSKELLRVAYLFKDVTAGLSANQLGHPYNLFVVRDGDSFQLCANAQIIGVSGGVKRCREQCLSRIGKPPVSVRRNKRIWIKYYDLVEGKEVTEWITDQFQAQVIQHEIDHGKGILI